MEREARRGVLRGLLGALLALSGCNLIETDREPPLRGSVGQSRDLLCLVSAEAKPAPAPPEGLPAALGSCLCAGDERSACFTVDLARGDRRRSALLAPGTRTEVAVPRGAARWLRFSAAAIGSPGDASPLELEVSVASDAADAPLTWRRTLAAGGPWTEASLDLAGLGDGELRIGLGVSSSAPGAAVQLALGMPRLVEPSPGGPARAGGRADVLLYMVDTLRPDRMSLYGYARDTTPRMEALFADGFVFENAYSTAAWTRPATASLLTSLYPSFHGANPDQSLPDDVHTLAERFRAAGWTTLAFVANGNVYGEGLGFEQGFDRFLALRPAKGQAYVHAEEIHRVALEQLAALEGEPVFVYVHAVDPHAPYGPPEGYRGRYADPDYAGPIRPVQARRKYLKGKEVAPADVTHIGDLYDEDIHYQDAMFGELMDALSTLGRADRLVTIVTSDHGEELYDHGDWEHGKRVYEEQVRIPLAIHVAPRPPRSGRRIDTPVAIVDVMPTLLSWFDLPGLESCQGESLDAVIAGRVAERPVYCEELRERFDLFCYREGPWKLSFKKHHPEWEKWGGPEKVALYHLGDDPGESRDLAEEEPERVQRMLASMFGVPERFADRFAKPGERDAPELEADTLRQLEALGYRD